LLVLFILKAFSAFLPLPLLTGIVNGWKEKLLNNNIEEKEYKKRNVHFAIVINESNRVYPHI
jgi:hypothetical protein